MAAATFRSLCCQAKATRRRKSAAKRKHRGVAPGVPARPEEREVKFRCSRCGSNLGANEVVRVEPRVE